MNYLYHWVPENMHGEILYPLNKLKEIYPELYKSKAIKYKGREGVMKQFLPTLGCLWNDVLHFSAVHPSEIKSALIEAGLTKDITFKCYQVNPDLLEVEKTTVYFSGDIPSERMKLKNFVAYDPNDLSKYSLVPEKTKDYYKSKLEQGEKPLTFHNAPHILYRGTVNIKDCPIVEV